MGKFIDLTGKKYGRWIVLGRDNNKHKWLCRCECGTERLITAGKLNDGSTKSCGCAHKVRGGLSHHTLAPRYRLMLERCYKTSCKQYKDYGGRGIYVCDRWLGKEGLINYIEDISSLPHAKDTGYELDRINNDGNYSPENCRWIPKQDQMFNKRNNRLITFNNTTKTITEWARDVGINRRLLGNRIDMYHWPVEKALTTPVRMRGGCS